jgi:hypothetical protein
MKKVLYLLSVFFFLIFIASNCSMAGEPTSSQPKSNELSQAEIFEREHYSENAIKRALGAAKTDGDNTFIPLDLPGSSTGKNISHILAVKRKFEEQHRNEFEVISYETDFGHYDVSSHTYGIWAHHKKK